MISIIVPVYNVEKYLRRCIDSILCQTYQDLEIILVDDGSMDKCGEICDEYRMMDQRIIVLHQKNAGQSAARNAGLDIASGEFIGFVDSDDWIEPEMYEKLFQMMQDEDCDLVECGVNLVSQTYTDPYILEKSIVLSGHEALKKHLIEADQERYMPRVAVWSKLFHRNFWETKRFPIGKIHEEYLLTSMALNEAKRVGLLREGLYNYNISNISSTTHSRFGKRDLVLEEVYAERLDYLRANSTSELSELAEIAYFLVVLSLFWRCVKNQMSEQNVFLDILLKNKDRIINLPISKKRRLELFLLYLNPNLYKLSRSVLGSIRDLFSFLISAKYIF